MFRQWRDKGVVKEKVQGRERMRSNKESGIN
jgi:hypothetical protein